MGKDDKDLAASTAREHVVRLSVVMNGAVEDGIILRGEPGVSTQLPQPVIAAMVGVAIESGMRLSELCALRQEDIDFLRREIRVDAQLSLDGKVTRVD